MNATPTGLAQASAAILLSVVLLAGCQAPKDNHVAGSAAAPADQPLAETMKTLLPESTALGKPTIVDFGSKFCLACKTLRPKLAEIVGKNPGIVLLTLDAAHLDKRGEALRNAFHVTTVPVVAFVDAKGNVKDVLYDDAPLAELSDKASAILSRTP